MPLVAFRLRPGGTPSSLGHQPRSRIGQSAADPVRRRASAGTATPRRIKAASGMPPSSSTGVSGSRPNRRRAAMPSALSLPSRHPVDHLGQTQRRGRDIARQNRLPRRGRGREGHDVQPRLRQHLQAQRGQMRRAAGRRRAQRHRIGIVAGALDDILDRVRRVAGGETNATGSRSTWPSRLDALEQARSPRSIMRAGSVGVTTQPMSPPVAGASPSAASMV